MEKEDVEKTKNLKSQFNEIKSFCSGEAAQQKVIQNINKLFDEVEEIIRSHEERLKKIKESPEVLLELEEQAKQEIIKINRYYF